ncbi:MAG: lipid-A-disaccharide synthase [Xanthobacteraceae bacterium]
MTSTARPSADDAAGALKIFLVATEASGDRLGAALMRALRQRSDRPIGFSGVGGHEMADAGLQSLYPIDDFSIIGFAAIPRRLPKLLRYKRQTVQEALKQHPHALVAIDSPSYTLRVARSVREADPTIPIIEYVSPAVWAWRPWRARKMRRFVDHILALLPFEPEVHQRLGGPPCTYVGHPLTEEAALLRPNADELRRRQADPPVILALPGSRGSEIEHHARIFGDTLAILRDRVGPIELVVPTVPQQLARVTAATAAWPVRPRVIVEQAEKQAAVRIARAALAKSGTITLELAVAGVPMVAAYKVSGFEAMIGRSMIRVPSTILANLVIGENVVPELLQEQCTAEGLAARLVPLIGDTPERRRQLDAFARLDAIMEIGKRSPAARAADIVLASLRGQATAAIRDAAATAN